MSPGEVYVFADLEDGGTIDKDLEEVRVTAFCLETYVITATCTSGEPCMVKY
jgi:hypothetical protein